MIPFDGPDLIAAYIVLQAGLWIVLEIASLYREHEEKSNDN